MVALAHFLQLLGNLSLGSPALALALAEVDGDIENEQKYSHRYDSNEYPCFLSNIIEAEITGTIFFSLKNE
jgi:hypothetical protein